MFGTIEGDGGEVIVCDPACPFYKPSKRVAEHDVKVIQTTSRFMDNIVCNCKGIIFEFEKQVGRKPVVNVKQTRDVDVVYKYQIKK